MSATLTYVYCLVAASRRPVLRRARQGLPGSGPIRLLPLADPRPPRRRLTSKRPRLSHWAVVADVPLAQYDENAINRGLSDLAWIARAAVAHERVIESFINAAALLPMKLFTIFTNDERAVEHLQRQRRQLDAVASRVAHSHEWGLRIVLDQERAAALAVPKGPRRGPSASGAGYLARKKAQRDRIVALGRRARETVGDLYDRLAPHARVAKRRGARDLPTGSGPLLLDAAFLVARSGTAAFRAAVAREARTLGPQGYGVTLSGPWPPYSFM